MTNTVKNFWDQLHDRYAKAEWIDKPSLFAQEMVGYFPATGKILDLGGGQGQDSRFFAQAGYEVTLTDFSDHALKYAKQKLPARLKKRIIVKKLDMTDTFPYPDKTFEVVYSHLAVHYFDEQTTAKIFGEIYRVLKPGGIVALLVNSINDPEFGQGEPLEDQLFIINGVTKRYFSLESMKKFTKNFKTIILDDRGKTYKDRSSGTQNLIQFVGCKIKIL